MVDKFSAALGSRLRAARRQRGWSLSDVESVTEGEFKASVVGAYERGERAISVQRLVRLSEFYGMNASDLLPATATSGVSHVIDLDQISSGDGDISERFIAAIHLLRSSNSSREIRAADRVVLSSLLEVESQAVSKDG
ncbi:MAG: XRE family transcriptional regulator [Actinobacteria bacterium]|nr:MAG: XRE family transcriptional regulator [Actinomycetota bacterium]